MYKTILIKCINKELIKREGFSYRISWKGVHILLHFGIAFGGVPCNNLDIIGCILLNWFLFSSPNLAKSWKVGYRHLNYHFRSVNSNSDPLSIGVWVIVWIHGIMDDSYSKSMQAIMLVIMVFHANSFVQGWNSEL